MTTPDPNNVGGRDAQYPEMRFLSDAIDGMRTVGAQGDQIELVEGMANAVQRVNAAIHAESGDSTIGAAVERFVTEIADQDADTPMLAHFRNEARVAIGGRLIEANQAALAARIVASIPTPELMLPAVLTLGERQFEQNLQDLDAPSELFVLVLAELDGQGTERAVSFLRYMRLHALRAPEIPVSRLLAESADALIAERLGEGCDILLDWAASEAQDLPYANWPGLASLVRADELWPSDTPLYDRQVLVRDMAVRLNSLGDTAAGLRKDTDAKVVRQLVGTRASGSPPIYEYILAFTATSLFERNSKLAEVVVGGIGEPLAVAYIADALLRQGMIDAACRLVMRIDDPHMRVSILMSNPWLNNSAGRAQKILNDLVELEQGRLGKPIFSQYAVEERVGCMFAFADIQEARGLRTEADRIRANAKTLRTAVERGRVVVRLPKRR